MTESDLLTLNFDGDVATLALSDQKTRNAFSVKMADDFKSLLPDIEQRARALVITGEGQGFCSGADLNDIGSSGASANVGAILENTYNPALLALRNLNIPVVSAINGPCAGIGCSLAMTADIIVMSNEAFFLQAFSKIGLIPDGASCYLLAKSIGRARAAELVMLDERLTAEAALNWGLVNRVVDYDALMSTAQELAAKLAQGPTLAYAEMRKLLWSANEVSHEHQLALEAASQAKLALTNDHKNSVKAFLARETPKYTGD